MRERRHVADVFVARGFVTATTTAAITGMRARHTAVSSSLAPVCTVIADKGDYYVFCLR